jgi:TonB-linked SusC/RagA family outer membrane protein
MRTRLNVFRLWLSVLALLAAPATAFAQAVTVSGKVTSEAGLPLEAAQVFIDGMNIGSQTLATGAYTFQVPAARVSGQAIQLRVRAIGYRPETFAATLRPGQAISKDFVLRVDVNRLSEVVVTGSIEGTERANVPFAVGRLAQEDLPVPAANPMNALQGKVPGMRIAQAGGAPGTTPEIMMRGPTSINASGRSQSPLIIVDGVIMRVGNLTEIGGLDIESVEVVKGAAGASLYGTTAANGVMIIKTKRGGSQDGVKFNVRSEFGFNDMNSLTYGMPLNHQVQLDETGKRFCVLGNGPVASCSRTLDWMKEIMRINSFAGDTIRTSQSAQYSAPGSDGSLTNVYQGNRWPGQYYNSFAQVAVSKPTSILSVDATGRAGSTRFFVSGGYTNESSALRDYEGQQQVRGRVNLDYEARSNLLFSTSVLLDNARTDETGSNFGALLRGAPPGTDNLAKDSLGRYLLVGSSSSLRGTGNGTGGFLYAPNNQIEFRESQRVLANMTATYFPADWVTFEGLASYDRRARISTSARPKGYRTTSFSSGTNFGNMSLSNLNSDALNGSISMTLRKQLTSSIASKFNVKGLYDQSYSASNAGGGQQFIVNDVFTISNTSTNQSASSSSSEVINMGVVAGANFDIKGKYIVDGTYRYDGSSLFGAGNRWAPFGRISGVWRMSEEPWFKLPKISDARFRISRGTAGNTPSFTAQYETYSCSNSGCSLGQAGNSKLKPETTTEVEMGVDFTLFDRLGVEITKSDNSTRDQMINAPTPSSMGFTNQWINGGTLENHTYEVAVSLPVITQRDMQWNMRFSWDRTRTYITELAIPDYNTGFFLMSDNKDSVNSGYPLNRYGNIWGRHFYHTCGELPAAAAADCGDGKNYQMNDKGWVVWVGAGNSWRDGITKNLWQTKLPAVNSPWNTPLYFGMPIVVRPLKGEKGEGLGRKDIVGNTLPSFRLSYNSTFTYKKATLYALFDGTYGHYIYNEGEQWGLFDMNSSDFDQEARTVETAKPIGYNWRVGAPEHVGIGGFYDILGANNYSVENGSYVKLRELSLSYKVGPIAGVGDWTFGIVGRNIKTWTSYSGYDPETGISGGQTGSGLILQQDSFDYPTLRTITLSFSTRF